MKNKSLYSNIGLFALRVGFSGAMLTHGYPKLEKLIAGGDIRFADPFGIGPAATLVLTVFGELIIPIILILGFKTRLAAIPAIITMAVAFFMIHAGDPFGDREMAFLYLVAFVAIALLGAGKFSIDGIMTKKRR